MFGLGMVSKESFLTYSTQFIFLIIRLVPGKLVMVTTDICGKSLITGELIHGITWKHVLAFMFFVYYLFVCLIIFLHFYICNVWFILANNRILVFILELFLFSSLLFKVYNNVFTCQYVQRSSHSRVLLKIVILYILGEFPWWGPFPVELQVLCLPFWWGWAPSWVFLKYFIYCANWCFLGNCP